MVPPVLIIKTERDEEEESHDFITTASSDADAPVRGDTNNVEGSIADMTPPPLLREFSRARLCFAFGFYFVL